MDNSKNRVLLVVDGSYQSLETVNYVSQVLPPDNSEVVMLHIISKVPEAFWDLEKTRSGGRRSRRYARGKPSRKIE